MKRLLIIGLLLWIPHQTYGHTWRVPSECPTLKTGCDSASSGDTILVEPGIYRISGEPENWWLIGPGVAMVSEGGPEVTVLELCNISVAVGIFEEGVRFSGFTVRQGYGPDCGVYYGETEGIWCTCTDVVVEDCIIEHFYHGIYMDAPSLNWWKPVFRNNIIRHCSFGIAIHDVLEPGRPYVESNTITECYRGVEIIDSSPMLADNVITGSTRDGLYYAGHCGGNCKRNVIANNGEAGVLIFYADPPLAVPDFNGGLLPADANEFYGNGTYDIDYCYSHQGGVMAKWNWWGADCPDLTGKFRGLVYYEPWTDATHTQRLDAEACEGATEPTTWGAIKSIYR